MFINNFRLLIFKEIVSSLIWRSNSKARFNRFGDRKRLVEFRSVRLPLVEKVFCNLGFVGAKHRTTFSKERKVKPLYIIFLSAIARAKQQKPRWG